MNKNILILGDGLLAGELQSILQCNYISRKKDKIDFCSTESYFNFLKDYDTIINCIGYVNTYCNNKELHWNINYKGVADLCDYCFYHNKKLIHISSDYVYANSVPNASELDVPSNACNWYSYTKLLSDGYIQLKLTNYLLIRTSFKKYPLNYKYGWSTVGNFDFVKTIATLIVKLINKECTGLFNVGTEKKCLHELIHRTNSEVIPTDNYIHHSTPSDVSMNISKMKNLI